MNQEADHLGRKLRFRVHMDGVLAEQCLQERCRFSWGKPQQELLQTTNSLRRKSAGHTLLPEPVATKVPLQQSQQVNS
eukprot:3800360-Amphidinium_carterae.1